MSAVEITYDGVRFVFDAGADDDFIRRQIVQTGRFFEESLLEYIRLTYPRQRCILDIGANFGNHTLFFSAFLEHRSIVCFEPCRAMFQLLRANVGERAILHNVALGEREALGRGEVREEGNAGTFTVCEDHLGDIPIRTLDSYELENVTLMKVDAEWMELPVIRGGLRTIEKCLPVIFAEGADQGYIEPIVELLGPLGYSCRNMAGVSLELGTTWMLTTGRDRL